MTWPLPFPLTEATLFWLEIVNNIFTGLLFVHDKIVNDKFLVDTNIHLFTSPLIISTFLDGGRESLLRYKDNCQIKFLNNDAYSNVTQKLKCTY